MGGLKTTDASGQNAIAQSAETHGPRAKPTKAGDYAQFRFLDRIGYALLLAVMTIFALSMWSRKWESQARNLAEGEPTKD